MTVATQAAHAERENGAHQYRRSAFRLRTKDRIQTILLSNIRINYDGFLSTAWGASYKVYPANMSLQLAARRHLKTESKSEQVEI